MRVYISIDMEGVAGVATFDQVVRGGHGYPRAQELMTAEANAAIAGAFDGGAEAVTINDSHGTMDNLIHAELDPRARVVFGSPKLDCMAEGIDESFDVALFVGYHAAAGSPGVLAHTFSSAFTEVRVNVVAVSEADVNALQAAAVGVPVGLVTGDDMICRDAGVKLTGIETVQVKLAKGHYAADSLAPGLARDLIREASARTVQRAGSFRIPEVAAVIEVEVDQPNVHAAEMASMIPGAERIGSRTVRMTTATPRDAVGFVMVCYQFAAAGLRGYLPLVQRV